jgi:hypothetical protein
MPESDRHARNPITFRPAADTWGWLDDIAAREGRPVRAVVRDAVERERVISEAGLAAFDRECTRRLAAFFDARSKGRDGAEESRALMAAEAAYRRAIAEWEPPGGES